MNTRNPSFGDWSAFEGNSDCAHLRGGGEPGPKRTCIVYLSHKRETSVRLESALRGFKTDDITHRAMTCFATNTPFDANAECYSVEGPGASGYVEVNDIA